MNANNIKLNSVVKTFLEIVQIDSPTGFEEKMSLEVNRLLNVLHLVSKIDKNGNVLAFIEGDTNKEPILLTAHLDTVEPGRNIIPEVDKNGVIHSTGPTILGADNKAGVAVILDVARKLIISNLRHHPIEIVFTVSEESGNKGATSLDYSKLKSKTGYAFDISSKNLGDVLISSPFYNRIDIEIIGKTSHAKDPDKGLNVLPIFAKAICDIQLGRVSKNTLVNIGIVQSGTAVNSIPGSLLASGEVRSTTAGELKTTTELIKKTFLKYTQTAGMQLNFKENLENPGYKLESDDQFLLKTIEIIKSFNLQPEQIDSFGCTDANIFAGHGIKVLNIASGAKDAHSPNESVKSSDLETLVEIVLKLINTD